MSSIVIGNSLDSKKTRQADVPERFSRIRYFEETLPPDNCNVEDTNS